MSGARNPRNGAGPREPKRPNPLAGVPLAATLSILGLLVIGAVTYTLGTGDIPLTGTANNPGSSDGPTVQQTPTPPEIVVVPTKPPEAQAVPIPGTFVYVKDGNVWLQSDGKAQQLTKGGNDAMPTFAPDGKSVYFVRERQADGKWSINGVVRDYLLNVPALMQIPVDGGKATKVIDGLVDPPGPFRWNAFLRNPDVSPSGRYIAIASELPDPTKSDVTLKIWDTRRNRLIDPGLSEVAPLGHQDPEWRPDGDKLIYVRNDRDGAKGTPRLYSYDMATEKAKAITGPGLPPALVLARRAVHRRDQDLRVRDRRRDPQLDQRGGAPAADRRRRQLGAGVVARRRPDRVPPQRGPGRGPPARAAGRHRSDVDGQGHARPDLERRPRRRLPA